MAEMIRALVSPVTAHRLGAAHNRVKCVMCQVNHARIAAVLAATTEHARQDREREQLWVGA